ncbi:MAG TPA: AbrB/MazE/SpoVT family DNA-binding domain-containing protein [Terriglobales bacterium]|jgi:antitoxin VapB
MPNSKVAKVFQNGRSQAVRLPREFRFEGNEVRVTRLREGVLLEPIVADPEKWFAEIDRRNAGDVFRFERSQPSTPRRKVFD